MMKKKIFVNAGHSFSDPGAISNGVKEAEEIMKIRDLLIPLLKKNFEVLTVPDDLGLVESIKRVNEYMPELDDGLAFSIHLNAGGGSGAEIYYYDGSLKSKKYAKTIIDEYCREMTMTNRGAKPDTSVVHKRLGWIRDVKAWSFLIEVGFIDNTADMKIISNHGRVADAINQAICKMFGVEVDDTGKQVSTIIEEIKKDLVDIDDKLNQINNINNPK